MRSRATASTRRHAPSAIRLGATGLVAILLAVACAPAASPSPSPSGGASDAGWVPETAWEQALVSVGEDGHYPKDAALQLFATAYGSLPGVETGQDLTGVFSRTIAIRAVGRVRDELTQEQRDAIDRALEPPAGAVKIVIPPVTAAGPIRFASIDDGALVAQLAAARSARSDAQPGTGGGPVALADPAIEQAIRDVGQASRDVIAANLGRDFLGEHVFYFVPRPADVQPVDGLYPNGGTQGIYPGGVFGGCQTTIYDQATNQSAVQLAALIAHETFHCFQGDAYRTIPSWNSAPHWISEGQATWVGLEVGGPSPNYDRFWKKYLTVPTLDLRQRAYDAVGFYAHLAEVGQNPWDVFLDMWIAGTDNEAAYKAAGGDAEVFVDSWASGVVREPGRGSAWDTSGPAITADAYAPPSFGLGDGDSVDISAAFYTNQVRSISATVDFVQFDLEGHVRVSDGSIDDVLHDGALYCVAGRDCERVCDEDDEPPQTDGTINSRFLVASSGSFDGTIGRVSGFSLPPCETDEPEPDVDPCATACGKSNGDVHIGTFEGRGYDFQGIGEFVLARSADGAFEVQARQGRLGDLENVSINTALAVKAGGHRMALYIDPEALPSVRLAVDGADRPLDGPVPFGAGRITPSSEGVHIDTGDGSHVWVIGMSYRGFNLLVEPGSARLPGIVGLMAPPAPGSFYPPLPDGSSVGPISQDRHEDYVQLYGTLGHAWRVTPETSLFDYGPGESTETFTERDFPHEGDLVYLDMLSPAQIAAGEEACKRVTDEDLHRMCVFDVGITADAGYGDLYESTITLLETGQLGFSGERIRVVNLYANDGRGTALDVYAWAGDATDFGLNSGTGPALVATVPFGQASAWFNPGQMTNGPFAPVNWISVQRQGEPILSWQFNLLDLASDSLPGLERVLVITGDRPDQISTVGGTAATWNVYREEAPEGYFPLIDAPAGKALGFLHPFGMYPLRQETYWAVSADGRCLAPVDFPTLATVVQGTAPRDAVLDPGTHEIAVHEFPQGADNFDLDCRRFAAAATTTLTVAAGDRVHLFPYAESATAPLRLLALPVGD